MNQADGYSADLFGEPSGFSLRNRPLELEPALFPIHTKRRLAHPTHISRIPHGTDIATAVAGCEWMGKPITPQGAEAVALLNARRPDGRRVYSELVEMMPRRSTKTTAIFGEFLGRCAKYPRTLILTTAQDGTRAREILRGTIMDDLEAAGFLRRGLARFRYANGSEAIEFYNGSVIKAVPPVPSKFRSKAADVILLDEAGETDADLGHAIIAAALPLMDTRPDAQLVVAGTPPEGGQAGLLWDELQEALNPKAKATAVHAYMLRPDESAAIIANDGTMTMNRRVMMRVHPGIGTVTNLATIRARFDKLTARGRLAEFEREYGCKFGTEESAGAIDLARWKACAADLPIAELDRPDRVGVAFDVEPDGSAAALVAAWRDQDGVAHLELLAFDEGYEWLPAKARAAAKRHRVMVAHDDIGVNVDVAQTLTRLRTKPAPIPLRKMQAAESRFTREIQTRNLRHYDQPDLTEAAKGAVWRPVGDSGRLFGRKASASAVSPIVAAAAALWQFDQIVRRAGVAGAVTSAESESAA